MPHTIRRGLIIHIIATMLRYSFLFMGYALPCRFKAFITLFGASTERHLCYFYRYIFPWICVCWIRSRLHPSKKHNSDFKQSENIMIKSKNIVCRLPIFLCNDLDVNLSEYRFHWKRNRNCIKNLHRFLREDLKV